MRVLEELTFISYWSTMLWANIYMKSLCPLLNCKLKFILIFRDYITPYD